MDLHTHTGRCAHPAPFDIVSRHPTSEGLVVYGRCSCGLLQVWREASLVLAARSRPDHRVVSS